MYPKTHKTMKRSLAMASAMAITAMLAITFFKTTEPVPLGGNLRPPFSASATMLKANSAETFVTCLKTAYRAGKDTIWVENNIDLSGLRMLKIPGNTVIAGAGRVVSNPLMYITTLKDTALLFNTDGDSIEMYGLDFRGASGFIRDYDYSTGYQGFMRVAHAGFHMSNCIVENWPTWGFYLYKAPGIIIEYSTIRGCQQSGYGYGIWVGGAGNGNFQHLFQHNLITQCRHGIASSGHPNDYTVFHNVFYGNFQNYPVERHNWTQECYGGGDAHVDHNYFLQNSVSFGLEYPVNDTSTVEISNNYFRTDSTVIGDICSLKWYQADKSKVKVWDNIYNLTNFNLPSIGIAVYGDSLLGTGFGVARWEWWFNNKVINSASLPLPGYSSVLQLRGYNVNGLPSLPLLYAYSTTADSLSFRFIDSYIGTVRNRYLVRVYNNNTILYTQDLATNASQWNLAKVKLGNPGDTMKIRLITPDTLGSKNLLCSIDDVFMGKEVLTFEEGLGSWKIKYSPSPISISVTATTANSYTGDKSLQLAYSLGKKYLPGQYVELWRVVPRKP